MIPDPVNVIEHDAVEPCLLADREHAGGGSFATDVVQVAVP
jgi:hypothetical protein